MQSVSTNVLGLHQRQSPQMQGTEERSRVCYREAEKGSISRSRATSFGPDEVSVDSQRSALQRSMSGDSPVGSTTSLRSYGCYCPASESSSGTNPDGARSLPRNGPTSASHAAFFSKPPWPSSSHTTSFKRNGSLPRLATLVSRFMVSLLHHSILGETRETRSSFRRGQEKRSTLSLA